MSAFYDATRCRARKQWPDLTETREQRDDCFENLLFCPLLGELKERGDVRKFEFLTRLSRDLSTARHRT